MPSTYSPNLGIELIESGEQSGTWGTTTNTNWRMVDQAIGGQTEVTVTSSNQTDGTAYALVTTDGSLSDGRNQFVSVVDDTTPTGNCYLQLTPTDSERVMWIKNDLTLYGLIVFQTYDGGSGAYTIPYGKTVLLRFNGDSGSPAVENAFERIKAETSLNVGDMTVGPSSITCSTGNISFGNENLLTSGTLGCGAFTSTGIDDNAPDIRLRVENGATHWGQGTAFSGYALCRGITSGSLTVSGGEDGSDGANILLNGSTASPVNDMRIRVGLSTAMHYDDSEGKFDFQANDIATTGFITGDGSGLSNLPIPSGILLADGTVPLTASWDMGGFGVTNVGTIGTSGAITTTAAITGGSVVADNITIDAATITSDTGAISFGDDNLSTTGSVTGGSLSTTGSVTGGSLVADNITIDAATITSDTGAISFVDDNLTTTGSVTAGQVVADNITIDAATITSDTGAISFGDENLTTTGSITGGSVVADNVTINAATITSDTGAISFGDENLTTTGNINSSAVTGTAFTGNYVRMGDSNPVVLAHATASTISRQNDTGLVVVDGGSSGSAGANISLYGPSHANASNMYFTSGATPTLRYTSSTGIWNFQQTHVEVSGDIIMAEKADHSTTPGAGHGYLWTKNTSPTTLIYTDDAGTDWTLNTTDAGGDLKADGSVPMTSSWAMGGFGISNVGTIGGTDITASSTIASPVINNTVDDASLQIRSGLLEDDGPQLTFYPSGYAVSNSNDWAFTIDGNPVLAWDNSLSSLSLNNSNIIGAGDVYCKKLQYLSSTRVVTGTTDTLLYSDQGGVVIYTNSSPIAVTLPDTLDLNWHTTIIQTTASGVPTVTRSGTDTINGGSSGVAPSGQWKGMYLNQYAAGEFLALIYS
jgi:hypothetical protein